MSAPAVTGAPGGPVLEDPAAEHEIQLAVTSRAGIGGFITVSCTCLPRGTGRGRPRQIIEARKVFPAAEAVATWRAWHTDRGIGL